MYASRTGLKDKIQDLSTSFSSSWCRWWQLVEFGGERSLQKDYVGGRLIWVELDCVGTWSMDFDCQGGKEEGGGLVGGCFKNLLRSFVWIGFFFLIRMKFNERSARSDMLHFIQMAFAIQMKWDISVWMLHGFVYTPAPVLASFEWSEAEVKMVKILTAFEHFGEPC